MSAGSAGAGSKKTKKIKWLIAILVILALGYYVASPYIAVYQMRNAAENRDTDMLASYIDFPAVRESVKEQVNLKVMQELSSQKDSGPFAALGAALGTAFAEKMVTTFITPAGLAQLMEGDRPGPDVKQGSGSSSTSGGGSSKKPFQGASMGYEGINKFVVKVPDEKNGGSIVFVLKRSFLSWQLIDVKLPM